jgi:hypothetical protein
VTCLFVNSKQAFVQLLLQVNEVENMFSFFDDRLSSILHLEIGSTYVLIRRQRLQQQQQLLRPLIPFPLY